MKKMMERFAACLLALGAAAVAGHGAALAADKRVAVLLGPTQDPYIGGFEKGFAQAAFAAGLKVTVFESPRDAAIQAQQIDDAIAQKFDLIVVAERRLRAARVWRMCA